MSNGQKASNFRQPSPTDVCFLHGLLTPPITNPLQSLVILLCAWQLFVKTFEQYISHMLWLYALIFSTSNVSFCSFTTISPYPPLIPRQRSKQSIMCNSSYKVFPFFLIISWHYWDPYNMTIEVFVLIFLLKVLLQVTFFAKFIFL